MSKFLKGTVILFLVLILTSNIFAQRKRNYNLINILGQTAYSYLLSANRPGYGVDAYTTDKSKTFLSVGLSYSGETIDLPVSVSYGVTKNFELSAGISPYTESYNFLGNKISGVGDSYIGTKYSFGESEHFIYAIQGLLKIPTASSSKELGTGKVDLFFGIAQGFLSGKFGYDLSFEFNLLKRRDFPNTKLYPAIIQQQIDSVKSTYNYKYEHEIVVSGGPSYLISEKFGSFLGFSFSRNLRLKYNSSVLYGGLGYVISNRAGIGFGIAGDILERRYWILSSNFYITL